MRVIGWWLAYGAFGGEAELLVERGRVAVEQEDYDRARDLATTAIRAAPGLGAAHEVYVEAATAAGLGARVLADIDGLTALPPPWDVDRGLLAEAVTGGDPKDIKMRTRSALERWPGSPSVLTPLWSSADPKVAKLREQVVQGWVEPEVLAGSELETLFAVSRVLREVGAVDGRVAVDAALVARGEVPAPARPPLGRLAQTDAALALSKAPLAALPPGVPSEQVAVITRLDELWTKAGRHREVAEAWKLVQAVSDDPAAPTGEALAWLRAGDTAAARAAAETAVHRAAGPQAYDLGASNAERQRRDLAAALLARARVYEVVALTVEATVDLATAHLLAGRTLDDKLGERLETAGTSLQRTVAQTWATRRGTSTEAALTAAAGTADPDARRAIVAEALFLAAASTDGTTSLARTPGPYVDVWARAHLVLAAGDEAAGRDVSGRTAAVVATILAGPDAHPHGWARRGTLHQRAGERDAAFVAFAVARGHGVGGLDPALEATYAGPGSWSRAADAVGGPPPTAAAVAEVLAAPVAPAGRRSGPVVGSPFPAFSVTSRYGTLTNSALRGKVVVITFFASSCGECLQMLPALGRLARTLRTEGRDVVVIGVSTDGDPAAFDDVFRVGEHWAELVHSPSLAERAGVHRVPTTWVVDGEGVARYGVDHWLPTAAIEAQVRELLK